MAAPNLEFLFRMDVIMGEPIQIGNSPYGDITFQHAIGGKVEGPKIKGELLPVGGDRVVGRTDGASEINVQALIKTDDGCTILMAYKGLIRSLGVPEPGAPPPQVYWRTAPFFETSAEQYKWLNGIVAVGVGGFVPPKAVSYEVYAVS